ncbi:MAG: SCP2 sterol-binding domain-containing protein [Anaerolineae bacterium]|nr:SCP2 sterol-binding domain-containing protein [Anaerolineae bacterium]MEB2289327.1 SCP2 sterol-binding domain-containing protein [Anaerolineae bacterium]
MPRVTSIQEIFEHIDEGFNPAKSEGVDAVFQFNLTGDGGGQYWVKVANQQAEAQEGAHDAPTLTITASAADYLALVNGDLNAMAAFMQGKVKVKGDMGLALKLQAMFGIG